MNQDPFILICTHCDAKTRLPMLVTGNVPACAHCGSSLTLPAPAIFGCRSCNKKSKPGTPNIHQVQSCPSCSQALELLDQPGIERQQHKSDPDAVTLLQADSTAPASALTKLADPGSKKPKPKHASDVLKGGRFGHFDIKREIARGGMGVVYEAEDRKLHRTVALKVLIAGEGATEEAVQRFVREARSASKLRHPHIVSVHEAGTLEEKHFFTMDFVRGREYADAIADTGLHELTRHIADVACALDYAHDQGVIHRDIKPANIMIDEHDRALVMDFGLARDANDDGFRSLTGQVLGTPAYMSPEQARGLTHELDARTDVYSLGAVLYEAACKQKPFSAATLFDTLQAVINADPTPPRFIDKSIDKDLETIILKCLEKEPDRRYACMGALAADLDAWLNHRTISARPVSPIERQLRRISRSTGLKVGLIVGPLVAILLILVFMMTAADFLDEISAELASHDPQRQEAALNLLRSKFEAAEVGDGERALRICRSMLGSTDDTVLTKAIGIISMRHDQASVPRLLEIANGDSEAPAIAAIDALNSMADEGFGEHDTVLSKELTAIANSAMTPVAVRAITLLDRLQESEALPVMISIAQNTTNPGDVRRAAIINIGKRSTIHSKGMLALLGLMADDNPTVRTAADDALQVCRDKRSVLSLYGRHDVASSAAKQLGKLQQAVSARQQQEMDLLDELEGRSKRDNKPPIKLALADLRSSKADDRLTAAYDLSAFHDSEDIDAKLKDKVTNELLKACTDRDRRVRRAASRSLAVYAKHHPIDSSTLLSELTNNDAQRRADAVVAFTRLEERSVLSHLLTRWSSESDTLVKRELLRAFGRLGDNAAAPSVIEALADDTLAADALDSLAALKHQAGLLKAMSHDSRSIREEAHQHMVSITGDDHGPDPAAWP